MKQRDRRRRAAHAASAAFWPSGASRSVRQREAMRGIAIVPPEGDWYEALRRTPPDVEGPHQALTRGELGHLEGVRIDDRGLAGIPHDVTTRQRTPIRPARRGSLAQEVLALAALAIIGKP